MENLEEIPALISQEKTGLNMNKSIRRSRLSTLLFSSIYICTWVILYSDQIHINEACLIFYIYNNLKCVFVTSVTQTWPFQSLVRKHYVESCLISQHLYEWFTLTRSWKISVDLDWIPRTEWHVRWIVISSPIDRAIYHRVTFKKERRNWGIVLWHVIWESCKSFGVLG